MFYFWQLFTIYWWCISANSIQCTDVVFLEILYSICCIFCNSIQCSNVAFLCNWRKLTNVFLDILYRVLMFYFWQFYVVHPKRTYLVVVLRCKGQDGKMEKVNVVTFCPPAFVRRQLVNQRVRKIYYNCYCIQLINFLHPTIVYNLLMHFWQL